LAYGSRIAAVLALVSSGGGDPDSGPSGTAIALLLVLSLVVVPAALGLVLRFRDARRRDDRGSAEPTSHEPPESPVFASSWGRTSSVWRESTRSDWMLVAALAVAVLAVLVATQV
jgi:hypothetical protein